MVARTNVRTGPAHDSRPSLLAVTSELPWPLNTGGHLRTYHLLRALAGRFRCRLIAAGGDRLGEGVMALGRQDVDVRLVPLPRRTMWREGGRAAVAAARREPYVFYRRHLHRAVRAAVRSEFKSSPPDVMYLDHLDSFVYRADCPSVPAVVDLHNVYSSLLAREAVAQQLPLRWYLAREARLLDRAEQRAVRGAAAVLAVSDDDAKHFQRYSPQAVHVVPNGVDAAAYAELPLGRGCESPLILFVGTMSWAPNTTAVSLLARSILPAVRAQFPAARLRIVGKDPPKSVQALTALPGVEVTGAVPSMIPHLTEATALAVPLTAGGGTRLKILEAFAAGLPVVSTPVGCEGIRARHDEHLLVANVDGFSDALRALFSRSDLGARLAGRAREVARTRYDWAVVGREAVGAIEGVLGACGPAHAPSAAPLGYSRPCAAGC